MKFEAVAGAGSCGGGDQYLNRYKNYYTQKNIYSVNTKI